MEKLERVSRRLSEKQISKIEKEYDFFKEKGYVVTDEHSVYLTNGKYYFHYILEKEGFHKVQCGYDISPSGRVYRTYNLIHAIGDYRFTEDTKSFDTFINRYF